MHGAEVFIRNEVDELSALLLRNFVVWSAPFVRGLLFPQTVDVEWRRRVCLSVGDFLSGRGQVVLGRENLDTAHTHLQDTLIWRFGVLANFFSIQRLRLIVLQVLRLLDIALLNFVLTFNEPPTGKYIDILSKAPFWSVFIRKCFHYKL